MPQIWDKNLPSASRFTILPEFNNEAVRDNNTGLVWERAPDGTTRSWDEATAYCVNKIVGGSAGWRLPSVVELKSLQDPSLPAPFVPTNLFTSVQIDYWAATTFGVNSSEAWVVSFFTGTAGYGLKTDNSHGYAWAVRGPMDADIY
jgi:hypothetical protein